MAEVVPFRGVRFDPRVTGPIGALLAPPYDAATASENGAHYSISRIEDSDLGDFSNQHAVAASRYADWLRLGVLRRDEAPAVYVHTHEFKVDGATVQRTGLIARVGLNDWSERVVLPHEQTMPGPRLERLCRLRAVGANLSPLYFLHRDPAGVVRDLIAESLRADPGHVEHDRMGGTHRLQAIVDPEIHHRLTEHFANRTLFVADGHHRYEAALAHRREVQLARGPRRGAEKYVLALLAAAEDPGVRVRPTHRLLVGEPLFSEASVLELLRRWFDVRLSEDGVGAASDRRVARVLLGRDAPILDLLALPGNPHRALMPQSKGPAWMSLGVSAIESIIDAIDGAAATASERHVVPSIDAEDAVCQVRSGVARAAFLLPTPNLDRLLAVAEEGDLLPPKSTWFEPKAPAGLVISDLRR